MKNAVEGLDARPLVDRMLAEAVTRRASDVHLEPGGDAYEIRFRVDGLLQTASRCELEIGRAMVSRLMVAARLLTYRMDIPQEGRLSMPSGADGAGRDIELRLAVMPTIHGLRAAVRMPAEQIQPTELASLGLPENVLKGLQLFARADAGMLILTGPAGAGKTTTIYALLTVQLSRRRGFLLLELFATLILLGAFAVLATELFRSVVGVYHSTAETQDRKSEYESAARQMRTDAWSANAIRVVNPEAAELNMGSGTILWRIDQSGALIRADNSGRNRRWEKAGRNLAFSADSTSLMMNEPGNDPALATRFSSQVLLGGGAK